MLVFLFWRPDIQDQVSAELLPFGGGICPGFWRLQFIDSFLQFLNVLVYILWL
jgi:hypothetical protein